MSHTIVTEKCIGVAECVNACPVACIYQGQGKNSINTNWYWIDFAACIDCSICIQVCPTHGAILDKEEPSLQNSS